MTKTARVTVKEATSKGRKGYTATVSGTKLKNNKVATKTGTTFFTNLGTLKATANALVSKQGFVASYVLPTKKAAKKSVKSRTSATKAKATAKKTTAKKAAPKAKATAKKATAKKTTAKKATPKAKAAKSAAPADTSSTSST